MVAVAEETPALLAEMGLELPPTDGGLGPAPGEFSRTHRLHYRLLGAEGDPLAVIVHGIGDFTYSSRLTEKHLLGAGFRVLNFDFRGRGWSDPAPAPAEAYDLDDHVSQLDTLLRDLGLLDTPRFLICHSMGGVMGVVHAANPKHAKAIRGLVLIAPAGALRPDPTALIKCVFCCCTGCGRRVIARITAGPPPPDDLQTAPNATTSDEAFLTRGRALNVYSQQWHAAMRAREDFQRDGFVALAGSALRVPFSTIAQEVESRWQSPKQRNQRVPVLVLASMDDPVCGRDKLDMAQYHRIFGEEQVEAKLDHRGKHAFHMQDAETVLADIVTFLQACPPTVAT